MDNPYLSLSSEELSRRRAELENEITQNGGSVPVSYNAMSGDALARRRAELEGSIAQLKPRIAQMDEAMSQFSAPAPAQETAGGEPVNALGGALARDPDYVPNEDIEGTELGFMGNLRERNTAQTGISWETVTGNRFLQGALDVLQSVWPLANEIMSAQEGERRLALADALKTGNIDATWTDGGATTRALNRAAREWDETEGAKYDLYRRNAEGGALNEELGDIAKMERGKDGRLHPVLDENGDFVLDEKYAGPKDEARKEAVRRHARGMLELDAIAKDIASRKVARDTSSWWKKGLASAVSNAGYSTGFAAGEGLARMTGLSQMAQGVGGAGGKLLGGAAALALPVVVNAVKRYYQLRADDVYFDEDGRLRTAGDGLGVKDALVKGSAGSLAENLTEVALGKVADTLIGGSMRGIVRRIPGAKSMFGKAAASAPTWLKRAGLAIAEGYGRMQNYTHLDGFPGEMAEEFVQGAFDDVLGLDLKDPRQKKQMGQFTREFFDWDKNFKDLAVGMLFTMAGQAALGVGAGRIRNQMNSMSREVRGVLKANGWTDAEIEDASYKQRLATAMSLSPELSYNMRYGAAELARLGGMSENDIKKFTENGDLPYAVFALSDAMNTGVADQEGKEGGRAVTLRPTAVTDADGNMFVGKNGKALTRLEEVDAKGLDEIKEFMTHFSQAQQDALNLVNERMALDGWRGLTQADLDAYGDVSGFNGKEKDGVFWTSGENGDKVAVDNATGTKIVDVGGNGEMYTVSHPGLNTDYIAYGWESARNWADRAAKLAQAKEARRGWKQGFVQDMVKRIVPDGGKAPSVRYYNTVTDIMSDETLPSALRERAVREGAEGGGQAVALPDGSIAVFLDNMQTPGQAAVGIVHEIAGHGALDAFFTGKEGGAEKRADLNRRRRAASEEALGEDVVKDVEKYYADSALDEELNVRANEGIGGNAVSGLGRTAVLPVGQGRFQRLASRLRQFLARRTGMQFDLTPDEWDAVVVEGLERMARGDSFPRPQTAPRRTDLPAAKTRTDIGEMVRGSADKTMAKMREAQRKATMLLGYTPGLSDKDKEKLDKLLDAKRKWAGTDEFENAVAKYRDLVRQYRTAQAANKNTPKGEEKPYSKEQMKEMRDAISAQWKVLQAFGESEAMQKRVAEKQTTQADRDSGLGELFEAAGDIEAEAPEEPEKPVETSAPEVKETSKEPPKEAPKSESPAKTPVEAPRSAPAQKATTTPPKGAESVQGGKSADLGAVRDEAEDEGKSEVQKAAAPALKAVVDAVRSAAKFIEGGIEIPAGILNNLKYALRGLKKHPYAHWDLPLGGNRKATLDDISDVNEAAKVLAKAVAKEGEAPSDAVVARLAELLESELGADALRDHDLDVVPREVRETKAKKEKTEEEQAQAEADEEARGNLVSAVQSAVESGDLSALKIALEPFKKDPNLSWNFGQGSGWNLDRLGANKNKAKWNRIPESIVNMGGQFILSNAVVTDFVRNVAGEGASEENVKAAVAAIRDALGGAPATYHAQAVVNEDVRAERREKSPMNEQARRMARANKIAGFLSRHFGQGDWNGLQILGYLKNIGKLFNLMYPFGTTEGAFHTPWPTDKAEGNEWTQLHFNWSEATGNDPFYTLWLTNAEESDYNDIDPSDADILTRKVGDELETVEDIVPYVVDYIADQRERFDKVRGMWESLPESLREQLKKSGFTGKALARVKRRLDRIQDNWYAQAEKALSDYQQTRDLAKAEKDYAKLAESYDAMDDDAKQVVAALRDLIDERRGADQYVADSIALREAFLAAHPNSDPFAADITPDDIEEARDFIGDEAADRLQREKDLAEMDWSMADTAAEDDGSPLPFRKAGRGAADKLRGDVDWLIGGGNRVRGVFNRWRLGSAGVFDAAREEFSKKKAAKAPEFSRRTTETPAEYAVRRLVDMGELLERHSKAGAANKGALWAQIRPMAAALARDVRNGTISIDAIRRRWDELPSAARVAAICALSEDQLKNVIPMNDPRIAKFGGNRYWQSEESLTEAERKVRTYALDAARRVEKRDKEEIEAEEEGLLSDEADNARARTESEWEDSGDEADTEGLEQLRRGVRRRRRAEQAQEDADIEAEMEAATRAIAAYSGMGARNVFSNTDIPDGGLFRIMNDMSQREGDRYAAMEELFRRNYPYVLGHMFRKTAGSADAKDYAMRGMERALGYRYVWEVKKDPKTGKPVIDPETGKKAKERKLVWKPSKAEFKGPNNFRSYAMKIAQNEWKMYLRQLSQSRVGESVVSKPRAFVPEGEDGKMPDFIENLKAGETLDGFTQRTADEWEDTRAADALMRHGERQYKRWKAMQPLDRQRLLSLVEEEWSIADIAKFLGRNENTVKTDIAKARQDFRAALSNPFMGWLNNPTSAGERTYEDVMRAIPHQQAVAWAAYIASGGSLAAAKDALEADAAAEQKRLDALAAGDNGEARRMLREWADREASDVTPLEVLRDRDMANLRAQGDSEALAKKKANIWMESRRRLREERRKEAERREAAMAQGDLFAALMPKEAPAKTFSNEHVRMLLERTKKALEVAGLNPDGSVRLPQKVPMMAQEQLTEEAAKEASGVPMMARREQAKETPKAEATPAPAPSIPGLKRRERAVQGDLFDMKWRKSASSEQQRIIGVLEKLMTNEGTPDMRWRKAQDVLKKEGLFGGAMSEHIARMRKQEFPDGSTEKVGAESLVIRTGDTVKKYRDARSFTKDDLDKIMWHNDLFGDRTPYEFKDVVYDDSWSGDYRPARIVLEQPYVEIREGGGAEARRLLVEDLKRRFGADNVKVKGDPSSEGMEIDAGPYHISDLKDLNVGIDERTGDYAVWDANIEKRKGADAGGKADVRWRRVTPAEDAAYMDAVERGDTETADRMVREAADRAGYGRIGFHGTTYKRGKFTTFQKGSHIGSEVYQALNRIGVETDGPMAKEQTDLIIEDLRRSGKDVLSLRVKLNNPLRISDFGDDWSGKDFVRRLHNEHPELFTNAEWAEMIKDPSRAHEMIEGKGYDGLVYDNGSEGILDYSGDTPGRYKADGTYIPNDSYIPFHPSQIKSAESVTRDDAGNVIPLSQRFNPDSADIRWRRSGIYTGTAADYANRSRQGGKGDGPSLLKIGSGAGSQVYGWGLYGSTSRSVADGYAKSGRENERPRLLHNGEEVPEKPENLQDRIMRSAFDAVHAGEAKNVEGYLQGVIDRMSAHEDGGNKDLIYFYKKYLDEYKENKSEWEWRDPKEFVYEQTFFTNRKPGDESHLLNWREPVGQRERKLAEELLKEKGAARKQSIADGWTAYVDGRQVLGENQLGMMDQLQFYNFVADVLGSPRAASEWLAAHDIDGMKFRAGEIFGRRKGEENAYNYISFRDDNIRVDHKWRDGEMLWRKSAPFSAEADSASMTEDERRTIEEMRRDPKFSYSGYMAERAHDRTGELARGEAKLANATSFLEKAKLFFTDREVNQFVRDRIREGLQDQHIHLRRMEERMFGGLDKIDKGADLYYFRDANIGRAGNLEMEFEREMITPLHDEIKKLGDNGMDRLNLVLNALHAPERNRMIAERTDGKTLDGSGMTTAFAKAVLDKAAADGFLKAEFDPESKTYRVTGGKAAKAVGLVRRIIDNTRQLQVQSGRKSAADAKNEAKLSPNYVPLRTDMEDTLKEFAHAFGRQSLADSPVAYSELLLKAAMSGYYENVERRRLAQLVQKFPGYGMVFNTAAGDILTETQVERFKKFLDYMKEHGGAMTERMAEELEPLGIASQKELEARLAASGEGLPVRKSLVNGKVRESVDTAALDRKYPDIVSYMRDGQVWFVRLGGEKLSKAEAARIGEEVKKSGMLRLNLALKTIRKATRWFSQLRTSYSPEFLVSNFFADNRQAVQNIMSTFGVKAAAQFERNIGSVFGKNSARSSAARYLRGELDPAKYPIDRYTQEWAKNGGRIGGMSFSNFKDVDDGIRKLVRDYEQAARGDKKLAALGKKIKKAVEDLNAAVEMGTRIAAYATCRENGYSIPDAVSYSRDITVNFDRRGNWTPVLNSLYAFSNASIQDVHRTLVAIGGPADWAKKGGKRGLAVLAGMALLGFLRAALGYGQDDPEEAVAGLPQYEYTSEYEKQDMFGLRVGKANYAIPIRGLARLPYYAGQKAYEVLADKTSAADAAKDLGSFVAQNVVDPIGNSDNLLQTVAPSIIRPAVEYAQNTNFAGNQIFRQPRSSKDVKSEMGYRNTQGVFKWVARALNELTGGSASRSGMIDMQPEKIQHIYSAITGSLGADLLRAGNFAYDLASGEDVLAVDKARNVPFLRRVRRDLAANSRTFRDAKDRYEADLQDWNANEGNSAVRAEIARSAPYLADERWAQELKDLSNAAQKLMTEENKAEGEERKAAQELRMRVQALFIRRLKEPPRQTPFAREQKQAQKESALFLKKRKESQKRTERRGRIPMMP